MYLSEVHISDIVGRVVILDLSSSPVHTLDLDGLIVLDGAAEWDYMVSMEVLSGR